MSEFNEMGKLSSNQFEKVTSIFSKAGYRAEQAALRRLHPESYAVPITAVTKLALDAVVARNIDSINAIFPLGTQTGDTVPISTLSTLLPLNRDAVFANHLGTLHATNMLRDLLLPPELYESDYLNNAPGTLSVKANVYDDLYQAARLKGLDVATLAAAVALDAKPISADVLCHAGFAIDNSLFNHNVDTSIKQSNVVRFSSSEDVFDSAW